MNLPEPIQHFMAKQIERLAAPLCIEYDSLFCLVAYDGPAARYGLEHLTLGEILPPGLDFLQGMDMGEPLSLSFVTLPTGAIAHIELRQAEQRRFILLFDASEQHRLVQAQQQQANEVRLLSSRQQRTLDQLSRANAAIEAQRNELEQQRNELAALNQAQARYIAMMSHEFRTPLNAILGYTDLLQRQDDPLAKAAQKHHLAAIRRSAWHLSSMVENVLEQARLGRDQVSLTQEPAEPSELVMLLNDLFQSQAKERDIQLQIECDENTPDRVMLDIVRIRQIAINLIGNALRYTSQGSVHARFSYASERLILVVQDTGPGIPEADRERIFRAYERGESAPGGGAGLGLSICRQLAQLMGGNLELLQQTNNKEYPGACFQFVVPAPIPDEQPLTPISGRVLVLDDDPDLREWLDIVLSEWGLQPTLLSGIGELKQWLREQQNETQHKHPITDLPITDLFITDYLLEDGVGVEAMQMVRRLDPDIPVVMLTGSVPSEESVRVNQNPNFLLLAKPISASALRISLGKMLAAQQQYTANV